MCPIPPELDMSLLLKFIGVDEGTGHFKVFYFYFSFVDYHYRLTFSSVNYSTSLVNTHLSIILFECLTLSY